jgi:hypothetical protein
LAVLPPAARAETDLGLAPTRLVLDASDEAALTVVNLGTEAVTIELAMVERKMTVGGDLVPSQLGETGREATPFLLYAPRRVTLEPRQSQVVRFVVRPSPPRGEYRSHLEILATGASKVYRVTVPVLIRRGQLAARVTVTPHALQVLPGGLWQIEVQAHRTGNASAFGDLQLLWSCPQRPWVPLVTRKGVAIYAENSERDFSAIVEAPAAQTGCRVLARFVSHGAAAEPPVATVLTEF